MLGFKNLGISKAAVGSVYKWLWESRNNNLKYNGIFVNISRRRLFQTATLKISGHYLKPVMNVLMKHSALSYMVRPTCGAASHL